jgi:hypothetical protein
MLRGVPSGGERWPAARRVLAWMPRKRAAPAGGVIEYLTQ